MNRFASYIGNAIYTVMKGDNETVQVGLHIVGGTGSALLYHNAFSKSYIEEQTKAFEYYCSSRRGSARQDPKLFSMEQFYQTSLAQSNREFYVFWAPLVYTFATFAWPIALPLILANKIAITGRNLYDKKVLMAFDEALFTKLNEKP